MKKLSARSWRANIAVVLLALPAIVFGTSSNRIGRAEQAQWIVPPVADFTFNERWVNPELCGKRFWYTTYCSPQNFQAMDIERYAWLAGSEDELIALGKALGNNQPTMGDNAIQNRRLALFREGKIPLMHICMRGKSVWDEKRQAVLFESMPAQEEFRALNRKLGPNFLGWSVCAEWGNDLPYNLRDVENGMLGGSRLSPSQKEFLPMYYKAIIPKPVKTREEFVETAARAWRAINEPFDYQGTGHDNTAYWAIQWPALLGARSIITENRYGGRSTTLLQAFTRAAGRMGNIPWGYSPGANGELFRGIPPYRGALPGVWDQGSRGWCPIPPNCWKRMLYYWCMGNAAIINDEETHRTVSDPENDGTWRLNWYSQIMEEVMDFSDRCPDRGTAYTPIGALMSWDNGFVGTTGHNLKSFDRFEYDDGEHMTRELFNRVLYPTDESWMGDMDIFGASPYGDIYDPLRIDTPRGPLPMELLKNYKVLFAVGRQNMDAALADRLKQYVTQGGVLILNVKQLDGGLLGKEFVGVELGAKECKETGMVCRLDGKELRSGIFTYTPLKPQGEATALYGAQNGDVLAARHPFGKGWVITVGAHWMLEDEKTHPHPGETRARMLPMANDLIGRLVKAVLPFEVRGEHVPERVLYQVNRKGKGWVISLYNNSGREAFNGNAPEKVWPDRRVDVEIAVAPEIAHAVEWIGRDRLGIVRDNDKQAGALRIGLDPGDVRVVEIQPDDIPPAQVVERVNLALNRPVKTSSSNSNPVNVSKHGPELAVNGNRDIYDAWWSEGQCDPKMPQWLEVDLGEVKRIGSINTIFMWSEDNQILQRIYQYYVETSVDGQTWKKAFDESKNTMPAHPRGHRRYFDPVDARYVRIMTTLNTAVSGAQIVEFEVYGDEKATRIYNWNNGRLGNR